MNSLTVFEFPDALQITDIGNFFQNGDEILFCIFADGIQLDTDFACHDEKLLFGEDKPAEMADGKCVYYNTLLYHILW